MSTTAIQLGANRATAHEIVSKAGKTVGQKVFFAGDKSAAEAKKALSAAGVKGRELSRQVREVLTGQKDMRQQLAGAMLQALFQDGYIPDVAERREKSATIKLVRVEADKADIKLEAIKALAAQNPEVAAALEAAGLTL